MGYAWLRTNFPFVCAVERRREKFIALHIAMLWLDRVRRWHHLFAALRMWVKPNESKKNCVLLLTFIYMKNDNVKQFFNNKNCAERKRRVNTRTINNNRWKKIHPINNNLPISRISRINVYPTKVTVAKSDTWFVSCKYLWCR